MLLLYIIVLLMHTQIIALTIGSDAAVDRFNNQVTLNNGDRIASFAAIKGGLKLANASVRAVFDSCFPVSGTLALNGGTLDLNQDLVLANVAEISTLGSIDAHAYSTHLSSTVTVVPSRVFQSGELDLLASAVASQAIYAVDWSYDDRFIAVGLDGVLTSLPTVGNYTFNGINLTSVGTALSALGDVLALRWHPNNYYIAVGRATTSPRLVILQANGSTGALTQISSDVLGIDVYAVAWHPTGNYLGIGARSTSAEVQIYPVNASGVLNAAGKLSVDISPSRNVQQGAFTWHGNGNYFAVGVEAQGSHPTLLVYQFGQPTLSATINASVNTDDTVLGVAWNRTYQDVIAVGLNSSTSERVQIYRHNAGAGTLTKIAAVANLDGAVYGVSWSSNGQWLAIGKNAGTDKEIYIYEFNNVSQTLKFLVGFEIGSNTRALRWDHNNTFLATGNYNQQLLVYQTVDRLTRQMINFSDLNLVLNNSILFDKSFIQFSGKSRIDGQSNYVSFSSTATLCLNTQSSLLFKNVVVDGLTLSNLHILDNTSTFSFDNVTLELDNHLTVTQGTFEILGDLTITGKNKIFTYGSSGTCKLYPGARLLLDEGVTFSYDPPVSKNDLILFSDDTAQFCLNNSTLYASNKGLQLNKGTLSVNGYSYLVSGAVQESQAIRLGDGLSAANNMEINYVQGATLDVSRGFVIYDNL